MKSCKSVLQTYAERKKWIKTVLVCICLLMLLAIGKILLQRSVENFAVRQLQTCVNKLTGKDVHIGHVSYNLWKQRLVINRIGIPNPEGYPDDNIAFYIHRATLDLVPWQIFKNMIHIKKLTVSGIWFNVVFKKYPQNVKELAEVLLTPEINLLDLKSAEKKDHVTEQSLQAKSKEIYIRIDKLQISGAKVTIKWKLRFSFSLPDYVRENLGADGKLTIDRLATEALNFHLEEMHLKVLRKAQEFSDLPFIVLEKIKKKYLSKEKKVN